MCLRATLRRQGQQSLCLTNRANIATEQGKDDAPQKRRARMS